MRKYVPNNILLAVIIIILFLLGKSAYRYFFKPSMSFHSKELFIIDNGTKTTINNFKGKVIIVSCFQTWCGDCARETPILNQLASKFDTANFRVIFITDENNEKLNHFRNRLNTSNILFTTIPDKLSSIGIRVYPTSFLIDKKGITILTKQEGYDWLEEEQRIKNLINPEYAL